MLEEMNKDQILGLNYHNERRITRMSSASAANTNSSLTTKKEQVVHLATTDPFMRVSEIAAKVGTTPRYVRTILCEARLSLAELRRNYARTMEKRLSVDVEVSDAKGGLSKALSHDGNDVSAHHPRITQVVDARLAKSLQRPADEPLLCVSRTKLVDGRPFFLSQVVTSSHVVLHEELTASDRPLRQILGLEVSGATEYVERSMEVVRADRFTAACLGVSESSPLLKSGNVIVTEGVRVGIEFNYFDAFRVRFTLSGVNDYALRVQEKTETEKA